MRCFHDHMSQFSTTDPVGLWSPCNILENVILLPLEKEKSAEAFPDFLGDDEKKTQDISKNNIENGSTYFFYENSKKCVLIKFLISVFFLHGHNNRINRECV